MPTLPEKIGPYEILSKLGAGGMGQVYRAHDPRLNRDVALKVLPPEFSTDPARKQRFEQEARAVAALNHPGIVSIYDVGDGWMVTELVEGENLRQSGFTTRQVIDIGAQIADALAIAHDAGISHRDLKPENVILTPDGRTKILDFGLAKFVQPPEPGTKPENVSTLTNPGSPSGTPGYMSPEQVRGQQSDHRSDFFSLGAMLYEMLAGHAAFRDESAIEVMHAIVHKDPEPLPDTVPEGLRSIIFRCLEKKPAQRFQSARDLAFALRSLSNTGHATPSTSQTQPSRWPLALGIGAVAALAIAYLAFRQPETASLADYKFKPFAFSRAQEHSGRWSPDGQSIAYIEQSADGSRLMVQSLDATAPTELVAQVSGQQGQLAWSGDSNRVYFLGVGQDFAGVSAISRAGGAPERIVPNAIAFDISKDGKAIALWRASSGNGNSTRYSVWISSPPGAEAIEYTPAPFVVQTRFPPVFLRFSPDGKKLFLSMYTEGGAETWLLPFPANGNKPRPLFRNVPWNRPVAAAWMPDSRHVVLSGNPAPSVNEQLWLADVETESLTRILAQPETAQATPSVSPDGKRILFSQIARDRDIFEFPLDGSAPRTLLSTALPEFGPSWSPKGDQFAFITQRNGTDELWLHSPQGNWDRPVVTAKDFPTLQSLIGPAFSPDASRIAYTALMAGGGRRRSLAISPVGGGIPTIIADGYAPTWSLDGTTIAFLWVKPDGTIPLATLRVGSDDPPVEIVAQRGGLGAPEWSPNGLWIAVPSQRGVEIASPDGKEQRTIPGLPGGVVVWSKDSKTIYQLMVQAPQPVLSAIDFATGAIRKIADYDLSFQPLLENANTGGVRLSLSPDGKSFVTAVATNQADLWILDGFGK
jgi:eukaryotic-like serine/threonine-protein kinase